jgi:hypothetical protein
MPLTTKELLLVKDNIKIAQNDVEFTKTVSESVSDQQVKTLCNKIVTDYEQDIEILMRNLNNQSVQ